MVSKLIKLSEDDLDVISDFFADIIEKKISASVKSQKQILAMDVHIKIDYNDKNEQLSVDVDVDIDTDELSKLSDERINEVIDDAYLELDEYINEHYREWTHLPLTLLCKNLEICNNNTDLEKITFEEEDIFIKTEIVN